MSTARWIKTPRVEIQWGQNLILHRRKKNNLAPILSEKKYLGPGPKTQAPPPPPEYQMDRALFQILLIINH